MSGGSLSQEEIDALLKAGGADEPAAADAPPAEEAEVVEEPVVEAEPVADAEDPSADLDDAERDTIGEVGNICMSSAATTLSLLLSRPVQITTPLVEIVSEEEVRASSTRPP